MRFKTLAILPERGRNNLGPPRDLSVPSLAPDAVDTRDELVLARP